MINEAWLEVELLKINLTKPDPEELKDGLCRPEPDFSKIKDISKFENGLCRMVIDMRAIQDGPVFLCNNERTMGTPIYCGPEKKITYLAQPMIDNLLHCNTKIFKAFHVPYLVDDIKRHVKLD